MKLFSTWVLLWASFLIIIDHLGHNSIIKVLFFSLLAGCLITLLCYSKNKAVSGVGINSAILIILIAIVDIFAGIFLRVSTNMLFNQSLRKQAHDLPNIPFHLKKNFKHALLAVQEPGFEMDYEGPGQVSTYLKNDSFYEPRRQNISIDSYGFRKHQTIYSSKKPEIIVLGDSFVFGYGNNSSETIPALLESKIKKPTYNMGVYGASVPNGIELLNSGGIKGLPALEKVKHIVLIVFGGNDFSDKSPYRSKNSTLKNIRLSLKKYSPIYKVSSASSFNLPNPLYILCDLNSEWDIGGKIAFHTSFIKQANRDDISTSNLMYKVSDIPKSFEALKNKANDLQANVLLLYLPTKVEIYGSHTNCNLNIKSNPNIKRLKRDALKNNFDFIDMTDLFKKNAAQKNLVWWRDDTHLNDFGAQIVANEIANHFTTLEN